MCFCSSESVFRWLNELEKKYEKIYCDDNITNEMTKVEFRKYHMRKYGHGGSVANCIFLAKQKRHAIFRLNEEEKKELKLFLNKIEDIHREFSNQNSHMICVNLHFYLHWCFPEKNIVPNYYTASTYKLDSANKTWEKIKKIMRNKRLLIKNNLVQATDSTLS